MSIRQQAILLCEFAASCGETTTLEAFVRDAEFLDTASNLADEAHVGVLLSRECDSLNARELWAEAAQRLREGWTP